MIILTIIMIMILTVGNDLAGSLTILSRQDCSQFLEDDECANTDDKNYLFLWNIHLIFFFAGSVYLLVPVFLRDDGRLGLWGVSNVPSIHGYHVRIVWPLPLFLLVNKCISWEQLRIFLEEDRATVVEIARGVFIKSMGWDVVGGSCKAVSCFQHYDENGGRVVIYIHPDVPQDELHTNLLKTILFLFEWIAPHELERHIRVWLPSLAVLPARYLQQCLLEKRKYCLDLVEAAAHDGTLDVYRSKCYEELHVTGVDDAGNGPLINLPVFQFGEATEGPKHLFFSGNLPPDMLVQGFSWCRNVSSVTFHDSIFSSASHHSNQRFPVILTATFLFVDTFTLIVDDRRTNLSRGYWVAGWWQAVVGRHISILRIITTTTAATGGQQQQQQRQFPDCERLTMELIYAFRNPTKLLKFTFDHAVVHPDLYWWGMEGIIHQNREAHLRDLLGRKHRELTPVAFDQWLSMMLLLVRNDINLLYLLVREEVGGPHPNRLTAP